MSSCPDGLPATGLFEGEQVLMVLQIISTLLSITVTSAWFSREKVTRLSLFFAHWLAGLVAGLGLVAENAMVTNCWTGSNLVGFIKALRFIELSAFNMFALTNLAISINLALIVWSLRTESPVMSVSSPRLLVVSLAISMAAAVPIIPVSEVILVSATGFYMINTEEDASNFINTAYWYVQFFVGVCMFFIVAWLLIFRLVEVKESWKTQARFRFYLGPTLAGVAVNLILGACGLVNLTADDFDALPFTWSWAIRFVQVALDTVVLYGVLRDGSIDERGDANARDSGSGVSSQQSGGPVSNEGTSGGSGESNDDMSKPVAPAPAV